MRNTIPSALCAILLCSLTLAHAQKTAPTVWEGDQRLAQKVRVQAEGIPVGELLRQLSDKTGITLEAVRNITDEKVIVFSPARPLRETLDDIAALLNDRWIRAEGKKDTPATYTLYRTRQAQELAAGLAEREARYVRSMLDKAVLALHESPTELQRRKEDDPLKRLLTDPATRIALSFYGLLDTRQRQQLFERGYLPPVMLRSLPITQQNALSEMSVKGSLTSYDALDQEWQNPEREKTEPDAPPPPTPAQRKAELDRIRQQTRDATLEMLKTAHMRFVYNTGESSVRLEVGSYSAYLGPFFFEEPAFKQGNPYTGKPNPKTLPLPEKLDLAKLAKVNPWMDRLRQLSEATSRPILSDYHRCLQVVQDWSSALNSIDFSRMAGAMSDVGEVSVEAAADVATEAAVPQRGTDPEVKQPAPPEEPANPLDAVCGESERYWWSRGNSLLFRNAKWYDADLFEPPDTWIRETAKRMRAQKGIPTYGDISSLLQLTPRQITGLSLIYSPALSGGNLFESVMAPGMSSNSPTRSLNEFLLLLQSAATNVRLALPRGEFPMLEEFRQQMDWASQMQPGGEGDGPPRLPSLQASKPGAIRATAMPPASWPKLLDFLNSLSSYPAGLNPKEMAIHASYQLGNAPPPANFATLLSAGGMPSMDMDGIEDIPPPAEGATEQEMEAYRQKYSAVMTEWSQKYRKWYENFLNSLLKSYANYEEMEQSKDTGQRVTLLWLSAFAENGAVHENFTVCLPLSPPDAGRSQTIIEVTP